MSNELREGDIARDVAQSLASEFGSNVITETEKQLAAGASGKRGFMPSWATDAAAIAGIIIGAVQLVRQLYSERKADKKLDELKAILEANAPHPERIDAPTRSKILLQVIQSLPKPDGNRTTKKYCCDRSEPISPTGGIKNDCIERRAACRPGDWQRPL